MPVMAVPSPMSSTASARRTPLSVWQIALTAVAAIVLVVSILPAQRAALAGETVTRLAMTTGIFNLLWVVVTVLMIVRPGSTTGV
jgi:hypothetical protein